MENKPNLSPLNIFKKLVSFETLFILFLFSYQYKNALPSLLSFDITLTLSAILIPLSIFLYCKNPSIRFFDEVTVSLSLFTLWSGLSIVWSPLNTYALSKILCFVVYTIPAFFMAYYLISRSQIRLQRFVLLALVFALLVHLEAYRIFIQNDKAITNVLGNNYLVTGQTLGAGFLLLVAGSFFELKKHTESSPLYCLSLLLCGTLVYIQLNLGGRGPVLGVGVSLLLFYLIGLLKTAYLHVYLKHCVHLFLSCIAIYFSLKWLFTTETSHFIARIATFPQWASQDESFIARLAYYTSAFQAYLQHPMIGLGFGGWPFYYGLGDLEWHPHNLILEVLSETGTIGALLFASFLYFSLKHVSLDFFLKSFYRTSVLLLLPFSLFNALKSGDLNDNILLFVILGLIAGLSKHPPQAS